MFRPLGPLLLTLPIVLVLAGAQAGSPAQAQSAREAQQTPLQGLMGLFQQQEAQAQPMNRDRIESEGLPPPGFATPNGGPPLMGPQSGHQFEPQSLAAPVGNSNANVNAGANGEATRPPGEIGSAPGIGGPSATPASIAPTTVMTLPLDDQPEQGQPKELPANLKKQLVDYTTKEPAGTIIVDTSNTYLYLVLGGGKALRYGIGVGREGFTWAGTERISKMKEWPDWHPPVEMIERQPYLPRMMAGGPGNPLGARALYLGNTLYRIHGTNQPSTIGQTVSSGCIRLLNEDIEDLFSRVQLGSRVVVLPGKAPATVANAAPPAPANPMAPPSANSPLPVNPPIMSGSVQPPVR